MRENSVSGEKSVRNQLLADKDMIRLQQLHVKLC